MIRFEHNSTNALTVVFEGKSYLFMVEEEDRQDDITAEELEEIFEDILDDHHTNLIEI